MTKNIIFCAIAILLLLPGLAYSGDFVHTSIDYSGQVGEMVVAPARNDGINRLYATGSYIFEYTWQDSIWQKDTVQASPPHLDVIAAGFGRNDSIWRLYAANHLIGCLYEYTYNGGTWDSVLIGGTIDVGGSIAIGDIKNDDTLRVVAGGDDTVLMAYTYQAAGNTWRAETLGVYTARIWSVDIGKGRNDDTNRVYAGGASTPFYEYWYNDGSWNQNTIASGITNSIIGIGRNDSANRLYLDGLCECIWSIDKWNYTFPMDTNISTYGGRTVLTDVRNDGKNRLYVAPWLCTALGGDQYEVYVFEKTYDSLTGWTRKEMAAVTSCFLYVTMEHITFGQARNDGINRLYSSAQSGEIFEWTWDDTLNGVEQDDVKVGNDLKVGKVLKVSPNPFYKQTIIADMPTNTEIRIYDITGRLMEKTKNKNIGHHLKSGIYFLIAKGYKPAKVIKIK